MNGKIKTPIIQSVFAPVVAFELKIDAIAHTSNTKIDNPIRLFSIIAPFEAQPSRLEHSVKSDLLANEMR